MTVDKHERLRRLQSLIFKAIEIHQLDHPPLEPVWTPNEVLEALALVASGFIASKPADQIKTMQRAAYFDEKVLTFTAKFTKDFRPA